MAWHRLLKKKLQTPSGSSLKSSEWLLVGSFFLVLSSLVVASKINITRTSSKIAHLEFEKMVEVQVLGAVTKPGTFTVLPKTPLKTILKKTKPHLHADLEKWEAKLVEEPLLVEIEELREIVITITGEVENAGERVVPAGTRICDLPEMIALKKGADKNFFRKKRELKNREKIEVPKKGIE